MDWTDRSRKNVRAGGVCQRAIPANLDDVGSLGDGGTSGEESGSDSGETHVERDGERAVQRADKRSSEVSEDEVTDSRLCLAIVSDRIGRREEEKATYPARGALGQRGLARQGRRGDGTDTPAAPPYIQRHRHPSPWKPPFPRLLHPPRSPLPHARQPIPAVRLTRPALPVARCQAASVRHRPISCHPPLIMITSAAQSATPSSPPARCPTAHPRCTLQTTGIAKLKFRTPMVDGGARRAARSNQASQGRSGRRAAIADSR